MNFPALSRCFTFILFFSLVHLPVLSQVPVKNYDKEWKKVEDLTQKGLPKSALVEVKKIYTLAKKEKQDAQVIKSLVYMTSLQQENREDNALFSIAETEKEIAVSRDPARSILNSLLGSMYWNYYQRNRWKIYDRTQTVNFIKSDIFTWGTEDFHRKISELYLLSVKQERLLQQVQLPAYDAIIIKGNMRHLRPTLFDLLAHRAISYFENDERDIKKPAYAFEISQAGAFDPAAAFVKQQFTTRDSLSLQHKALLLYQQLIAFHLRDKKPDALLDADLLRLAFVREKSTHPDKDQLYLNSVRRLADLYGNNPAAAQAWYLLARYYNEKADEYKPHGDTTQRYTRLQAKEICEKILQQKDSSEGKMNCQNLLNEINRPSFRFSLEKVNVPHQPFRVFLQYRNVKSLYLRVIRPDETLKKQLENQYDEKYWPTLSAAGALKSWEQQLPDAKDLQEHGLELKVDGLPAGEYILLASGNRDFNDKKTILGARYFYVSGISYVNSGNDFFVLNRDNGKALANASVQVWVQRYDYNQSKYVKEKEKNYSTDANGFFRMEKRKRETGNYSGLSYLLEISHNNDRLFMDEWAWDHYYSSTDTEKPKSITSIHLFTDRSLYRPGQTAFFKGIVLTRNTAEKTGSVKTGYTTTVYLRDANYRDIDSVKLTTSEFGSFNGRFRLPQSGLNGIFSVYTKTDNGYAGIRVEEYKRPKFYVEYEPVKGTYQVNDNIKVTGTAKAYAGNNIDGAAVKYRVVREPRFIYPWLFWRWWQPPSEEMEIIHGETITDKNGRFSIEFKALPDGKIDRKFEPVFDYTVYADVTDINGETRSGEKSVSVSYKSLMLVTNVPAVLPADSLKRLNIRTQNMNGSFEPAVVQVSITRLREEKRLIRDRFWGRPDQFIMTKEEYVRHFPNDEYDNESDYKTWEKDKQVFSKTDSVKENSPWTIDQGPRTPGYYMIEISTKDRNGQEVKDVKYTELFDEKSSRLNRPEYLWTGVNKTTAGPGEKASVQMGSSADDLFVVHQMLKEPGLGDRESGDFRFLVINNEKKTFSFDVSEADRGGFGTGWMFVKHNRVYQLNQVISVPWTNKDLLVEYATYRDKTLPGSEEKWKVKISGYKKDQVAAEMLAAMYDASLDQFYPHAWSEPSIWPYYYYSRAWSGSQNFNQVQSRQKYISDQQTKYVDKRYDQLFSEGGIYDVYLRDEMGVRRVEAAPAPPAADGKEANAEEVVVAAARTTKSQKNGDADKDGLADEIDKTETSDQNADVKIRKNFNETAFFLPELRTDSSGAIEFSFTMPEALTRWKFMAIAHTKEAAFGMSTKEIITQKDLMVQPNPPRFIREGDKMEFSSKIVNLTDKEITGTAEFRLFDAVTNEPVDGRFHSAVPNQYFTVAAGQSESVKFPIEVPYQFSTALVWRITAKAGTHSDGEENTLPVLTNRMLVTETMTLPMRGSGTKQYSFGKLLNAGSSETLQHHALTLEYTSNPAWYAIQALPYLMEFPYECAEQTWNRYYANSLASYIANSSPKIKQVFEKWKIKDTAALMSNLQKNQELKAVLLEETPWVLQAKNETEQKRNIALLFDMVRMSEQLNISYDKLRQMQSSNGGFVWFSGGPDDRYMTQYIITGMGHLKKLDAVAAGQGAKLEAILNTAIPYLDRKIKEDYDNLIKYKANLKLQNIGYTQVQYLYMRSFFPEYKIDPSAKTAFDYYFKQAQQYWLKQGKYMQGMIALALYRGNDAKTSVAILKSLKETSVTHEEMGMYWKDQQAGWFWYQAPVETQALLIEAFQEAGNDVKTVDELRTWLLKNKQTNNWKTTKATAEACYALLLKGTEWLSSEPVVEVKLGSTTIKSTDSEQEAGTGYFKQSIEGNKVNPQMGNITVSVGSSNIPPAGRGGTTWGAVYWQYFEDLDKISTASTPLKLSKKIFVEKNTDRGPVISPVNDGGTVKVGDKIKVRVELRVDRDMEYVHMKDMRASALEPVNVLSRYKWQGGLGYYESTRDAGTHFFFQYLRKGTYVFEYTLFATHSGNFSNGVTTIQCMYAPEFSSHSEGIRITVE